MTEKKRPHLRVITGGKAEEGKAAEKTEAELDREAWDRIRSVRWQAPSSDPLYARARSEAKQIHTLLTERIRALLAEHPDLSIDMGNPDGMPPAIRDYLFAYPLVLLRDGCSVVIVDYEEDEPPSST